MTDRGRSIWFRNCKRGSTKRCNRSEHGESRPAFEHGSVVSSVMTDRQGLADASNDEAACQYPAARENEPAPAPPPSARAKHEIKRIGEIGSPPASACIRPRR